MRDSVADISSALRADADALARFLLPGGSYRNGRREWRCQGRASPTGDVVCVHVGSGVKQGVVGFWNQAKQGGDMLDLVTMVRGGDVGDALRWARDWLGIGFGPAMAKRHVRLIETAVRVDEDRERRLKAAMRIIEETTSIGGAAEMYLKGRGIDFEKAFDSSAYDHIVSHPGLRHPDGGVFPALVARVLDRHGHFVGIWRVFVTSDGHKAPVETPKLGLGDVRGGAVRIGGVASEIGVAEGIETALACRQLTGRAIPVWAALSTSGMRGLELPSGVRTVRIFCDNDPIKFRNGVIRESPGMSAAQALCDRLMAQGITATIEAPPPGMDFLDVLNKQGERDHEREAIAAAGGPAGEACRQRHTV